MTLLSVPCGYQKSIKRAFLCTKCALESRITPSGKFISKINFSCSLRRLSATWKILFQSSLSLTFHIQLQCGSAERMDTQISWQNWFLSTQAKNDGEKMSSALLQGLFINNLVKKTELFSPLLWSFFVVYLAILMTFSLPFCPRGLWMAPSALYGALQSQKFDAV